MLPKARLHRKSPVSNHCWLGSPVNTRSMLLSSAPGAVAVLLSGLGFRPDLLFSNSALPSWRSSPRLLAPSPSPSLGSGSSGQRLPSFLLPTWRSSPASVELSKGHRECRPSPAAAGSLSLALLSWPGLASFGRFQGTKIPSPDLAWHHLSEVDIDVLSSWRHSG